MDLVWPLSCCLDNGYLQRFISQSPLFLSWEWACPISYHLTQFQTPCYLLTCPLCEHLESQKFLSWCRIQFSIRIITADAVSWPQCLLRTYEGGDQRPALLMSSSDDPDIHGGLRNTTSGPFPLLQRESSKVPSLNCVPETIDSLASL